MKFHYHILINPSAGSGNGYKVAERILPVLKNKHIDYTLHYSEYKGHDAEIAETLAKETLIPWIEEEQKTIDTFPLLIIVGGDGTLHQVLDTFYQMEVEFPVAYIPAGSGNDFARGAGLSKNPKKALQLILAAQSPEKVHIMAYVQQRSILFLAEESRLFQLLMRLNQSLILSWSNESISLKSCGSFFYLYRKNN